MQAGNEGRPVYPAGTARAVAEVSDIRAALPQPDPEGKLFCKVGCSVSMRFLTRTGVARSSTRGPFGSVDCYPIDATSCGPQTLGDEPKSACIPACTNHDPGLARVVWALVCEYCNLSRCSNQDQQCTIVGMLTSENGFISTHADFIFLPSLSLRKPFLVS